MCNEIVWYSFAHSTCNQNDWFIGYVCKIWLKLPNIHFVLSQRFLKYIILQSIELRSSEKGNEIFIGAIKKSVGGLLVIVFLFNYSFITQL